MHWVVLTRGQQQNLMAKFYILTVIQQVQNMAAVNYVMISNKRYRKRGLQVRYLNFESQRKCRSLIHPFKQI